ncbi:hypothetical protein Ndes2526B_g01633 [Nannochloris sp. 'desiccata']
MDEGSTCPVCFTGALLLHSGMLVCEVCGTTMQDYAEETQEFQTGISDAQFFRRQQQGSSQRASQRVEEKEKPDIAGGVQGYVTGMQQLLQKQLQALCSTLGASPSIVGVAQNIWMAYVAQSRVLEPSFAKALEAKVDAKQYPSESINEINERFRDFSVARTVIQEELVQALPLSTTLLISFLACWHAREAIGPLDIVQGALNGQLPYLTFATDCKEILEPFRSAIAPSLITPNGVPSPANISFRAAEMAATLGIPCPMINSGLWLRRFVDELNLTEKLFPIASTLYAVYGPSFIENLQLRSSTHLHPWAVLMAFVVTAVKFGYRMDGKEPVLSGIAQDIHWLQWARSHFSKMQVLSAYPLKSSEVLQSDPAVLSPYLKHLREVFFATCSVPESLTEYHTTVKRFSENVTSTRSNVAHADNISEGVNRTVDQLSGGELRIGEGFAFAGKRILSAASVSPLGPEYAALLSVCSLKTWIAPYLLAEAARQLEELIVNVECETAYRIDPHAQQQIIKMEKEAQLLKYNQS